MRNADLVARDLKSVWHPCTQMKDHETLPLIPVKRGEGVWLEYFENNRHIDAVSSWWVNLFGHANPRINAAIQEQIGKQEHVILAGFSHELRWLPKALGLPSAISRFRKRLWVAEKMHRPVINGDGAFDGYIERSVRCHRPRHGLPLRH